MLYFLMHNKYCHLMRKQWWIHPKLQALNVWILRLTKTMVSNSRESRVFAIASSYLHTKTIWLKGFLILVHRRNESDLQLFRRKRGIGLPLCCRKKAMVAFKTVDLSNFRLADETIEFSSLIRMLNWSRRFFSLRFLDFLNFIYKWKMHLVLHRCWI